MGENRTPHLADLPDRVREQSEEVKATVRQWWSDVQTDPSLLWRTTIIRVLFWVILGICAFVVVRGLSRSLLPTAERASPEEAAPLATLYVACVNPSCLEAYTTQQPMDFSAWPLVCRKCAQQTVYRAKPCRKCGRWYATAPGTEDRCPHCALPEPEEPEEARDTRPAHPDDAEDPW
jgi:hypothetical protein